MSSFVDELAAALRNQGQNVTIIVVERPTRRKKRQPELDGFTEAEQAEYRSAARQRDYDQAAQCLAYLNKEAGKRYRAVDRNLDLIVGRFREALKETGGDRQKAWLLIQGVIDGCVTKWLGDDKMDEYLRPATLFGPKNFWTKYAGASEAAE